MASNTLQIKLPTDYSTEDIKKSIYKELGSTDFTFHIDKKSLDARKKNDIHWLVNVIVTSELLSGDSYITPPPFEIPLRKRKEKVIVVGSGPAGFFAAHVLQLAGFKVTIIERGSDVALRSKAINDLEKNSNFNAKNNYAFGEGGAGTFSDGKLTSRSKHISEERRFIMSEYVKAGAPEEIMYMAHPHVGTDNLKKIVVNLRKQFQENGGEFLFDTHMLDMEVKDRQVVKIICNTGEMEADHVVIASGHSAYDTYRMLIKNGVLFNTKNFAIGHRVEHTQKSINMAQWGRESLPGVKAAEYRLSTKTRSGLSVYTFCMCPGGSVVPAAAYDQKSVVNGMSYYARDGKFSNAGCVAGVHPDLLLGHSCSPLEILDWMDELEEKFYTFSNSLAIPANKVIDYTKRKESTEIGYTSYSPGVQPAPLYDMLPPIVNKAISDGLREFSRKLKGFELGTLMGLESKVSSPLQVVREKSGKCQGFDNLYFVGEGSGYAGGIISSAADGVRCAMGISAG